MGKRDRVGEYANETYMQRSFFFVECVSVMLGKVALEERRFCQAKDLH